MGARLGFAATVTAWFLLAPVASAAPALPPPPEGAYAGAARTVFNFFNLYYGYAQDPEFCILSMRSAADSFKRNAETLRTLTGPEQAVLADYFQHQLVPYFSRTSGGVEGEGTYDELVARRQQSMAWLREHAPRATAAEVQTAAQIEAYAATERAYLARAAEDSAWVERLFAASPCIRWAARRNNEIPALGDFGIYRRSWVAEAEVRGKVRAARAQLVPALAGHQQVRGQLDRAARQAFPSASSLGTTMLTVAAAVKQLDAEAALAERVRLWAAALDPVEGALVAELVAGRDQARADAVAWFSAQLKVMALPPAAADQSAAREARALGATSGALAVRVLSPMSSFSEDRTEFADKIFLRPVRFSGKTFTFAQVRRGAPWKDWPADLGAGDLCSLIILSGVYYSAGANVPLRKWELHSDSTYPVACQRKGETYVATPAR